MTVRQQQPSFPRKRESIASDSEHMSPAVFQFVPPLDSCRADAQRWIPAFAGMTIFFVVALFLSFLISPALAQTPQYGIALHGAPHYPADFTHFDYVNPDAPKGGTLHLSALGTFDTLNPFTLKGVAAEGSGLVFETLMARSMDEPYSQYGWVAQSVTVAPDHTWVSYQLRPQAKFQDGTPITPEDVIFSFETLRDKGHPSYRSYYKDVAKVEKTGPREVRFTFRDASNTELPMIVGEMPVLCKHCWKGKDFAATTLQPIIGSGPYKIETMTPGRTIAYVRDKNWWAADLPVNKGRYNFDHITYDYYRDATVALEAFFAGRYDYRFENIAKNWALAYNTPAVQQGLIKKQEIKNELPAGMQAFIFNTRRPLFQDRRVREALGYAFDFEWSNKNFAYGAYKRTSSYFENSELAAKGLPSPAELKLLEPFRKQLPDDVFTKVFTLPKTDGSGEDRDNLRKAADLLRDAGWTIKNGVLTDAQGHPFKFEIIDAEPMFERWTEPFITNLKRLGIDATFRVVDTSQFQNRMDDFDFDMTIGVFGQSLSPGNEQFDMWGSSKANVKGSRNLIGVHDPVVDALLEKLVHAESREELVAACRALDRVLLWQYYVIPHWYIGTYRIAYWDKFGQPKIAPKYGLAVEDSWWVDSGKVGRIDEAQNRK
ncbi:MAG: extracellular solute-binding protein [Alphaproteobacteria bacterium]|nr:extracellular solute-binding protein [Alphaproteobacteria bacterium]